jgi:hypothetical protein
MNDGTGTGAITFPSGWLSNSIATIPPQYKARTFTFIKDANGIWREETRDLEPLTSISNAPKFMGAISIVGGVGYLATGITSTTDWKQITN